MSFLSELKRRKVIRVAIAYAIAAWLLLQLTEVLSGLLSLPEQVGPWVVGLVVVGFPVALILSWLFEFTSEGLKRDSDVTPEQRRSGRFINIVIIALLAVALAYFVWESRFQPTGSELPATSKADVDKPPEPATVGRSIAVLPFENFSGNPEDDYLADGLADTLLHKLAQISELKVIARNSSFQFKGSNIDVREIGQVLGVEVILEGSVQRSGSHVRIIAQLVRTSDGAHIWSQSFDDSTENIFELQDRITSSIVDQFQLTLSEAERAKLLQDGTDNPAAYDLVIRAMNQKTIYDSMTDANADEYEQIRLLKEALALDPDYALAWVFLAQAYGGLAFATDSARDYDRLVQDQQAAAEEALRLAPELPQTQSAMGWVAHRKNDRLVAAQYFRKALELDPNSLTAMSGLALQVGWKDPEEGLRLVNRSLELDPTSAMVYRQKHFFLRSLDRQDEAIEAIKKAIELRPDHGLFYNDLVDLLERKGRPDEGARYNTQLLSQVAGSLTGVLSMAEAWLAATDYERSAGWTTLALEGRDDSDDARLMEVERLLASQQYQQAIDLLDEVNLTGETAANVAIRRTAACLGMRHAECATQQINQFRNLALESASQGGIPPDFQFFVEAAQLLVDELVDTSFDSKTAALALQQFDLMGGSRFFGPIFYTRAGLLARSGDVDAALATLELAVPADEPGVFNIDLFGMDVEHSLMLDPLREQPQFADWLERYRERRSAMLQRMRQMELQGQIMPLAAARRNSGS